jgi:HEAT repeat protein
VSYLLDLARSSVPMTILVASTTAMFALAIGFLVAASTLRRANNRKAAHWGRLEANWGVTVEYIARGLAGVDTLHQSVQRDQQLVLLDFLYKSAITEIRSERKPVYSMLAKPYLPQLEKRVGKGDVWQRARAIRTIAELGGTDQSGVIIKALDDPAPHVAMTAARAYARLKLGPIEPLLERIESFQVWDRRLLQMTLVSLGVGAAPALHARFADAKQPVRTRAVCADTLARLDYPETNATAIAVLGAESDVDLRASALRLIRRPASEAHRLIVRSLCVNEDPVVRAQAIACLARIGDHDDIEMLEGALADLSPWVVLNATKGLKVRREDLVAPDLIAERGTKVHASGAGEWE